MTADTNPRIEPSREVRTVDDASAAVRRFGFLSAVVFVALSLAYAIPLTVGLVTLPSKESPIADPWFTMMEWLILVSAPFMVFVMISVHLVAPRSRRPFSLAALVFMSLAAVVTCSVHFTVISISHLPAIAALPWTPSLLTFTWPSVPYALDIVAWDFFFPLSVLLAAPVFSGSRLANAIRGLLLLSGLLSLIGLFGPSVNMDIRSIGIVGYAAVFPVAVALMARMFRSPAESIEP